MIEVKAWQLAGLLLGTAVATGALTFVLGYWYVRSKIEEKMDSMMQVDLGSELSEELGELSEELGEIDE